MIEQRNLILAVVLSIGILLAFQFFYEVPRIEQARRQQAIEQVQQPAPGEMEAALPPGAQVQAPGVPAVPGGAVAPGTRAQASRAASLGQGQRVRIESPRLHGSILLRGGRIDDITLADYHETIEPGSSEIVLLSPAGAPDPYYAEFGWVLAPDADMKVPTSDTDWQAEGRVLTPDRPLTLTWDNGQGLRFVRTYALDENFMFTVRQRVKNSGMEPVTMYPYGLISRTGTPEVSRFWILHEGPVGVLDDTLTEIDYDDLIEDGPVEQRSNGGWIGIKDQFWLVALLPNKQREFKARFTFDGRGQSVEKYQVDYLEEGGRILAPGATIEVVSHLFAGAKEVQLLESYKEELGVEQFHMAIDYTMIWFLTIPMHKLLLFFYGILGNYGLAILLLTVLVKIIFFPLANKSYKSMGNMKKLAPKVKELREQYGDDRERLNRETMALYKREKVNPLAGCLPMVIQIPVFFALYVVLFVTIEMRHAPFYGWIEDLSAPDPLTIFNLFGLLPWDPAAWSLGFFTLGIGIWPILMGLSMFFQMRLNPTPPDPMQAKLFMLMPFFFTFLLASFPAGLVIYWTCNNVLSMAQQWVIMRRAGARP